MLIAGDPSGDQLGAELVAALRKTRPPGHPEPSFAAAGGNHLRDAGVEFLTDLTRHSVIGLWEVLRQYRVFRRLFDELLDAVIERRPDVVIGVDYGGFNLRFARALRERARDIPEWRPKVVQFVSPQVWASRPGRARILESCHDLLLSILPFEPEWYARHAPGVRVEFVGHPLVDRHLHGSRNAGTDSGEPPRITLLPGSRAGELRRHLPVVLGAAERIHARIPQAAFSLVAPDETAADTLRAAVPPGVPVTVRVGGLGDALRESTLAIASTGTVTLECAWYGVPTLALYRTSWLTYQIGRRLVTVSHLAMPNLLAGNTVFPEFIQSDATPDRLADAALALLSDPAERRRIRERLTEVVARLGPPGACDRAAARVWEVLDGTLPGRRLAPG